MFDMRYSWHIAVFGLMIEFVATGVTGRPSLKKNRGTGGPLTGVRLVMVGYRFMFMGPIVRVGSMESQFGTLRIVCTPKVLRHAHCQQPAEISPP